MQVSHAERRRVGNGERAYAEDLLRRQVHRRSVDQALEAQELRAYWTQRQAKYGQRQNRQQDQTALFTIRQPLRPGCCYCCPVR